MLAAAVVWVSVLPSGAVSAGTNEWTNVGPEGGSFATLAVDRAGRRHVAWERQPEKLWKSQPSRQNGKHADEWLALLRNSFEPMLQRELEHRGLNRGNRGFEAMLVGWVQVVV